MIDYLTVEKVAKQLDITRQTVAKLIKDKRLNAIRINKNYRIREVDLYNYMKENSTGNIHDIEPVYRSETKNCVLMYKDKTPEGIILSNKPKGTLAVDKIQHHNNYNSFYFGDNLPIMQLLLDKLYNKVDLIYIDPPFGTGQTFSDYDEEHAYHDHLLNSEFLEFLRKRLVLLREMLSARGSIYVHIDKKIGHYVKVIVDDVFGANNFINDITRVKCNPKNFSRSAYGNVTDIILYYAKNRDMQIWNDARESLSEEQRKKLYPKYNDKYGWFTTHPLHAPGKTQNGDTGKEWNGLLPPKGRHWRISRKELSQFDKQGLIAWSKTGNPRRIVLAKNHPGAKIQDLWCIKDRGQSYVDYPTQKNHDLLERIILNSSNKNSIVLDCFAGSGSTLLMAEKLERKWIGIDNSHKSLQTIQRIFNNNNIKCNYNVYKSFE